MEQVGAVAQLGEHLLCKQGVSGSIPLSSTKISWTLCARLTPLLERKSVILEQRYRSSSPGRLRFAGEQDV